MTTPDQVIENIRRTMTAEEITEQWGTQCPMFDPGCACCQMWAYHDALEAAEAERDALRTALEDMRPHVDKLARCVRVNDEMGRVVAGQTEAIIALAEIHARTLVAGDNHEHHE